MNLHEYQAKEVLIRFGIPVPPFVVASNQKEVEAGIERLGLNEAIVKVQVHAGGRGKAGGVKFAKNPKEILAYSKELIGKKIVNEQTGPQGLVSHKVLISHPVSIKKEYYIAATIDRARAVPILIISREGGMEIEEVAAKDPNSILKVDFSLDGKVNSWKLVEIANFMKWEGALYKQGMQLVSALAKAFIEMDAELLEINPLVETDDGKLFAVDAKCSVDENALFRHKDIAAYYDPTQQTQGEVMAKEYDLAYIGLDGQIGCLVNGAGLAMATMDIIKHYGGSPANFLDVGGGATKEKVAHGFTIILLDPRVQSIFVNIFGGIMDCGVLAQGIIEACKENTLRVPLIVRMEGTNVHIGKQLLKESELDIITAETMADGAVKAVKAAQG